ncbi:PREDICTED: fatty acyl-CoA reductase 2-like, partial [Nelumbo nucifera]|uniref:Fatty acyl-CoA reductase n=1 Tax=Nelumbo nucifera TaxID=4432 RepID=A0A1U7ZAW1_NELNU
VVSIPPAGHTAYVNGQREGKVMEKPFYMGDSIAREKLSPDTPPASLPVLDFEAELKLASDSKEACDESTVAQKMKELGLERAQLYGWQDTYVFTKAMGEMLLNSMRGDIPVVIMRPSVIESTLREPFPGWIEGIRMMDPIILSYGKGQLTGFLTDPKTVLDVIPADMVVNATMAAMAKHGAAQKPELHVYQVASSVVNPLSYQDLVRLFYDYFTSFPCKDSKGRSVHVSRMKLFSSMDDFSSHLQTDVIQRSREVVSNGKLSKKDEYLFQKLTDQAKHLANIYEPYTFYGGRFDNTNTEMLMEDMSEEERRSFGFDAKSIDWKEYFSKIHIPGLRRHVMKGRG